MKGMLPMRGERFAATLRASVAAILGDETPPVSSRGSRFFNIDRWTGRWLVRRMCAWAREHPGETPTESDVVTWVQTTNAQPVPGRRIVLASVPSMLPAGVAEALVGGAYHEAFHTRYSCRRNIEVDEVADLVLPRWARIPDMASLEHEILDWSGYVEDIRIERLGDAEFPGVGPRLASLQDFIIGQESVQTPDGVLKATFRDLGLGYRTPDQEDALARYAALDPVTFARVTQEPLAGLLAQAVGLSREDDLGFLRVTFDVLAEIGAEPGPPVPEEDTPVPTMAEPIDVLLGSSSAMDAAVHVARVREAQVLDEDAKPWRPQTTDLDVIQEVQPSQVGREHDRARAQKLIAGVRAESTFLRARLRNIALGARQRGVTHGVRRGAGLSDQMLVDTVADIRSGTSPSRAFYAHAEVIEPSLAVVVVVDESESMGWVQPGEPSPLEAASRALVAIAEPLDQLGHPVMVVGIRDGALNPQPEPDAENYHRRNGVCFDVFKRFDERFITVAWRFANTRAIGGTPLADGVQFGLDHLEQRHERHKLLIVLTDGEPSSGHRPVLVGQLRRAEAQQVRVLGVGIGTSCKAILDLFPDNVWVSQVTELPKAIIQKLNARFDAQFRPEMVGG